jgi:hypothetical protein
MELKAPMVLGLLFVFLAPAPLYAGKKKESARASYAREDGRCPLWRKNRKD